MKNSTINTTETRKNLIDVILEHGIEADTPVKFDGRLVFKSSSTGKIYICNPETKRAFQYEADGKGCKGISLETFKTQHKAVMARVQRETEADRRIRENTQKFEAQQRTDHNAVLLDAEREDSKFDYRRSEEIFNRSEVEAYEQGKDLIDDDEAPVFELGYHKAYFKAYESVKGKISVGRDGQRYESAPYVKFTFTVNGADFTTRAYEKGFESFKRQMNKTHNGIFQYTRTSQALETLMGCPVDIWVKWNDVLNELQADFYDVEAYKAYKAKQAQIGNVRGGYGRPTENKATR